jgi:BMFP domain-containing protein YqiC
MPFGDYEDFDACVADNQDKDDPGAYCAAIKRQIEGASALSDAERDAIKASDTYSKKVLEKDPCWEDYVMVGTKTVNGQEVPNCVPEDEADAANMTALAAADDRCGEGAVQIGDQCVQIESVDAPASILSSPQHLTLKSLDTEPIERVQEDDTTVRYKNLKLLSPGVWADAGSEQATYYPPDGIGNLEASYDEGEHDGPPVNIMHDLDMESFDAHDASVCGHVDPKSLDTDDDGNLYGDIVFNLEKGAGQFADENLQSTLEKEGTVGFGGPSVEIPAEGLQQSHDEARDMPRVDGGLLSGVAMVMDPASKNVNFAREAARRPVALSASGDKVKVLSRKDTGMRDKLLSNVAEKLTLMDVDEVRETLDMFGFGGDMDEMTDEEVMDMAEDLHEDLMADLEGDGEGEDQEMGDYEDDEDEDEDDETEMQEDDDEEMDDDMDSLRESVANLSSRLEDLEDAMSQAMTSDDVGQELAAADTVKTLREEKEALASRVEELENQPAESKTLADAEGGEDIDWSDADDGIDYDPATGSMSR